MGILILFSSFYKLKPPVVFSIYLVVACASLFSTFLVCISLVSTFLVRATCVSTSGLVRTASFSLFLDKIFFVGTLVGFISPGLKLYYF